MTDDTPASQSPSHPAPHAGTLMPTRRRLTKSQRLAQDRLFRYAWEQSRDYLDMGMIRDMVPEAWHTLEQDIDVDEKKEKITLYLDHSVARFYRAMGLGYQARINRLLATWAQMKIADLLDAERPLPEE